MSRILGIHVGHDSSAALVVDGLVVASVEESRFNRVKHYAGLPIESIAYCINMGGGGIASIDEVALTSGSLTGGLLPQVLPIDDTATRTSRGLVDGVIAIARDVYREWRPKTPTAPPLYFPSWTASPKLPTHVVDHHLAHAASAYLTSGRQDPTVVFTADGIGDDRSLCVWRATCPDRFELLYSEGRRGSIGWFYGLVTEALGWWVGDGEGKTMGLAPYGSTEGIEGVLDKYCPRYENGSLATPHDFGQPAYWQDVGTYHWHFPEAAAVKALVERYGRERIAAEAQRVLEREMVPFFQHWLQRENTRSACFAGGLMLNVKMNQRVWESGLLDHQHIYPDPGDAGLSVGAALLVGAMRDRRGSSQQLRQIYWGPQYADAEISAILNERQLSYAETDDPASAAAERLAAGRIVAWFQGRMEAGPRALGGRSILMDTSKAENKDIINSRVKFREGFRPFCPSMTPKAAGELLDPRARPERFMITSFDVQAGSRARIPAVVHADGTARAQVVEEDVNPLYYRLLVEFGRRSGVECLLNTSFNIKGEPIVCSPREAIRCFYDTGLDSMILGRFVLDKRRF